MTDPETSTLSDESPQRRALELQLFSHIESQIALGESRASVLLAANALLAAAYATLLNSQLGPGLEQTVAGSPVLMAAATALAFSLLLALLAISPALVSTKLMRSDLNLMFFGSIAGLAKADFHERFRGATLDELESHLLDSIWGKSRKAREKFTLLVCATIATAVSVVLFLAGVAWRLEG